MPLVSWCTVELREAELGISGDPAERLRLQRELFFRPLLEALGYPYAPKPEPVLIGGEAYLHPGFLDVFRALKARGIRPSMTTGGKGIDAELARAMKEAGVHGVSVSVDGLEHEHNLIRQSKHSFSGAMAALAHLKTAGILIAANTNINRLNAPVLEALFDVLVDAGIGAWQVQITVPLGRAADRPQMLLQPFVIVALALPVNGEPINMY